MKLGALELEIEWNVLATRIKDKTCYFSFYYVFFGSIPFVIGLLFKL